MLGELRASDRLEDQPFKRPSDDLDRFLPASRASIPRSPSKRLVECESASPTDVSGQYVKL